MTIHHPGVALALRSFSRAAARSIALSLAVLLACVSAGCEKKEPAPPTASRPGPSKPGHIKIDEAKAAFDRGVQFIDARVKEEYDAGHVKGAIMVDPTDDKLLAAKTTPEFLQKLDPKVLVVTYCSGGDCDASELVALKLRQFGFASVKVFEDGFPAWKEKGYPIETK